MTSTKSFSHQRYDAIVIGARCAGAATAMLLARAGGRVLVVDRQSHGADTLSTHALMRGAVLQLSRWGLMPSIVAAGTPRIGATTFRYGPDAVFLPIKQDDEVDGLYAPRRTVLDPILVDAAWSAGAEIRHDTSLLDLVRDPGGRVIGAQLRDEQGEVRTVHADIVVGADGLSSTVARRAGASTLRQAQASTATLFAYVPDPGINGFQWIYELDASVGAIPTNDGLACVFVGVPTATYDDVLRHNAPRAYLDHLHRIDPELGDHVEASGRPEIRTFRGRPGFLRQPFGPGWALAGDAGFFRDPITAHGITDALRDADGLARAIIAGTPQAFQAYQAERDALAGELLDATDAIAAFDWTLPELQDLHKRLSSAMKAEVAAIAARPPIEADRPLRRVARRMLEVA